MAVGLSCQLYHYKLVMKSNENAVCYLSYSVGEIRELPFQIESFLKDDFFYFSH